MELTKRHEDILKAIVQEFGPVLIRGYDKFGPLIFVSLVDLLWMVAEDLPNPLAQIDEISAKAHLVTALEKRSVYFRELLTAEEAQQVADFARSVAN